MKKTLLASLVVVLAAAQIIFAHDPRAAAKEFTHSLSVEGAGKLVVTYRSLHWNEPAYNNAKKNEQLRARLNSGLWKKIGKLESEFDIVIGGVQVPKGAYSLGINFDADDNFKLVLGSGGKDIDIPLKTSPDSPDTSYLSFDIRPTDSPDTFVIEGRSGKFRAAADVKVPYLAPHDHSEGASEHKQEAKPAEKKP